MRSSFDGADFFENKVLSDDHILILSRKELQLSVKSARQNQFCSTLVRLLRIPFAHMILRRQEKMLGIKFDDKYVKPLHPKSNNPLIFVSEKWLIFAGTGAFSREYIEKLTVRSKKRKNRTDYYHLCIIIGKDQKKYYKLPDSASTAKKIREWYRKND